MTTRVLNSTTLSATRDETRPKMRPTLIGRIAKIGRQAAIALATALVLVLPAMAAKKAALESKGPPQATETLLSATDWRLGSFPMGEGETHDAYKPEFDEAGFNAVTVPGEVQIQTGLKGKDLFLMSKQLTLVNNKEWWYRKNFKVGAEAQGKLVKLHFDASSYFTTVWLNGEKLGEHEGEAQGFSFDISKVVKYGAANMLAVKVTCPWLPKGRGLTEYLKASFSLQADGNPPNFNKPPYFLGGGWGGIPTYGNMSLTMGIIRDVKLLISEPVVLEDLFVYTKSLNADGSATLEITGNAKNYQTGTGEAQIDFDLTPANFKGEAIHAPAKTLTLQPGNNLFSEELVVKNPQLWWTWDLGAQNLYRLDARLGAAAGGRGNSVSSTFGIRTIERNDQFAYRLNGQRVFVRGVWYPMADYYPSRATRQTYERDLKELRATYSNHLVTQIMEKPAFYDICDELGLLVFIQLPFNQFGPYQVVEAGNPRREPFLKNSREQVATIVKELRQHPSLVQWSPLAEARDSGKWAGPQEGYDTFIAEMEKTIRPLSPDTIFHGSLCDLGEHHTWGGNYRGTFHFQPILISEYGEISPPSMETFKEALTPDEMWSEKNPRRLYNMPIDVQAYMYWTAWEYDYAYEGILNMLKHTHMWVDQNVQSAQELVDATQWNHAFWLAYPTEAFRRKMHNPINGIRTWAYRDIYPGTQYGMVDSNGIPKMNYYFYKRAQEPLEVNFAYESALESQAAGKHMTIPVWVSSDYRRAIPVEVKVDILTTAGQVVWSKSFDASAAPDASEQVGEVDWVTPETPGVYVVRGHVAEKGGSVSNTNTTFIKVTPRVFAHQPRVLLIGWKQSMVSIAAFLDAYGAKVDTIDELSLERLAELKDPASIRARYNVVWLAPMNHFWKLVEPETGDGLAEAVRQGVGFIHSGGDSAFHGGNALPAALDLTRIAEILPVELITRNEDVVYPAYKAGSPLPTDQATIKDVAVADPAWTDAGLKEYGLKGYNQVNPKAGGKVELTIEGHPLLATGTYGKGRTVAFTGYTPTWDAPAPDYLDEEFDALPVSRAYFGLFAQMLAAATGEQPATGWEQVLAARQKPLYQMLKEHPATRLEASTKVNGATVTVNLKAGSGYARLVRLRAEWDGAKPYMQLYDDNYFDLLPGETKTISLELKFPERLTAAAHGRLIVAGSNVEATEIPVTVAP